MTRTKNKIVLALFITSGLFLFALLLGNSFARLAVASTPSEASDYTATSTAANGAYGAFTTGRRLKPGAGSFGSIVITGANTGVINVYNATTTDVNKRTGQKATSTILIASIPASTAAGTYVFDASYTDGLYIDLVGGHMPTSTITYR